MTNWRESVRVPMWCPLCTRMMKGSKSNSTYYNHNCCSDCFIAFVDGREEKWEAGERPSEERIREYYKKLDLK